MEAPIPDHEAILQSPNPREPRIALSRTWQVLGPFSLGTREAPWGADPLEFEGGFSQTLSYDPDAWFRGSLVPGADVPWTVFNSRNYKSSDEGSELTLEVGFGEIDWPFLQKVYGWAALQYQAWARGHIDITGESAEDVLLYTDGIWEFNVDGVPFFGGDFYSQRRAPAVLHLEPGRHQLDVRLMRDVRSAGGTGTPNIEVGIEVRVAKEPLELSNSGVLVSDIINGRFASSLGSITLRNNGKSRLEIIDVDPMDDNVRLRLHEQQTSLSPGQTRTLNFEIELLKHDRSMLNLKVLYSPVEEPGFVFDLPVSHQLRTRSMYEPHVVTFSHPSKLVSYAVLRPPQQNASCPAGVKRAPVFLALHGSGMEANSEMMTRSLDAVSDLCAWVLFPTGTTTWCGDDWHTWAFADVEAAIYKIPEWIMSNSWVGTGVDTERWFVSGHSNGGQGVWYALLHHPDKIIAAAPISGYSSIQTYVPYHMWQLADPRQGAVVQSALNSFRHEMLVDNAKGIPILEQHGVYDDNVPAYHARLMHKLLHEAGTDSKYVEIFKGHWFDGVMQTEPLRNFYYASLDSEFQGDRKEADAFKLVAANVADTGSKRGVKILRTSDPGQYAKVEAMLMSEASQCHLKTSNVGAFELDARYQSCQVIFVDQQEVSPKANLFVKIAGTWKASKDTTIYASHNERRTHQFGGLDAVLRTDGPLTVLHDSSDTYHVALQTSRNLMQYFGADAEIIQGEMPVSRRTGNVISIVAGANVPGPTQKDFPMAIVERDVSIRDDVGASRTYGGEDAVAAVYVRPVDGARLELVVWGRDADGVGQAARLIPTLTGAGQPDFVVLSNSSRWKGIGGATAMGFFDYQWNVSRSSYLA